MPPVTCTPPDSIINGVCTAPVIPPIVPPTPPVPPAPPTPPTPPTPTPINPIPTPSTPTPSVPTPTPAIGFSLLIIPFLKKVFATPILKITTGTFALGTLGVSVASALLLNPIATPEVVLLPLRLWSLLLTALGIKKRAKPWGTVYDSVTKQPLDPVYVSLYDMEGKEVASSITDINGRYGFLVPPGVYKVVPRKTNYIFPSEKLSKHFHDEFYQDLYFGDHLNISEGEVIVKNIPMDPLNFDWNEFAKNKGHILNFYSKREVLLARISNWLFNIGIVLAAVALIVVPEPYNIIIFCLYILIFILRRTSFKKKARGKLMDKSSGDPLSFALVKIFSSATNVEIAHSVADRMGRYFCLVPNGRYNVQVEKKNSDESYSVAYKSEPIEVVHGILNREFSV
jgi:hypothetical protein